MGMSNNWAGAGVPVALVSVEACRCVVQGLSRFDEPRHHAVG